MKELRIFTFEEAPSDLVGAEDLVLCGPWPAEAIINGKKVNGIAYVHLYHRHPHLGHGPFDLEIVFAYKDRNTGEIKYLGKEDFDDVKFYFSELELMKD